MERNLGDWRLAALAAALLSGCVGSSPGEFRELPDPTVTTSLRTPSADAISQSGEGRARVVDNSTPIADPAEVETSSSAAAADLAPADVAAAENVLAGPGAGESSAADDAADFARDAIAADERETPAIPGRADIAAVIDAQANRPISPFDDPAAGLFPGAPLEPRTIELLVPEKTFDREGREQALRVSYDDLDLLKVLNMEPVPLNAMDYFPGWLRDLDGQTVRLRGWMFPPPIETGLPEFLFVRDNQICCFGRQAKLYDKVYVQLKDGTTTNYIQGRPFDVIGTMSLEPEEQDGELYLLYFITDATVVDR